MIQFNRHAAIVLAALMTVAQSAYAAQPPDVVNSDNSANTAMGTEALWALNEVGGGGSNTAAGAFALYSNSTGSNNTGIGTGVLYFNTTGTFNTALGSYSLWWNANGQYNTATGTQVLYGVAPSSTYPNGSTGSYNTGTGAQALYSYSTGSYNTATGFNALYSDSTGNNNTANGSGVLESNTTGSNNIAEGYRAGHNLTTGNNNIDIGNQGVAGDTNTIKIGTQGTQVATYIAGIYSNTRVRGFRVVINSQGELGVVRDDNGQINGVRYDKLAPRLLHEVRKQAAEIRDLKQQQKQFVAQAEQLRDVQQQLAELHAALAKVQSKDELVAQR
jgi:hypothetical protein